MHCVSTDTRLGVATTLGSAVAAMCVQLVDASGNLAIHMPTRILLLLEVKFQLFLTEPIHMPDLSSEEFDLSAKEMNNWSLFPKN